MSGPQASDFLTPDVAAIANAAQHGTAVLTWMRKEFWETGELKRSAALEIESFWLPIKVAENGVAIALSPLGGPAAMMAMEILYAIGFTQTIAVGSAGIIPHGGVKQGQVVKVLDAYADAPSRYSNGRTHATSIQVDAVAHTDRRTLKPAVTWTTDAIFRENASYVELIKKRAGPGLIDMEAFHCMSLASFYGYHHTHLLVASDYVDDKSYNAKDLTDPAANLKEVRQHALGLALTLASGNGGDATGRTRKTVDAQRRLQRNQT